MAYNLGYASTGYNLGYVGDYAAGPSISAADAATEAQSATVTLANYVADPTELRLGGNVVAFTFSAGVLTYTAPLLPNNDALGIEVDVDGFTVSGTIAYDNTYPYTHTPAVIDDNSILPDTSFGTTELVELKVITDATASVLTVDWDGYDADNFASAAADFVTAVSQVAASTDVTMGYHITETGATGTFTRTLSVTDAVAPTGSITFGTPTITDTTISQPTSYAGSDATGFERRINGGSWIAYTSPITLSSLTAETAYLIEARATNAVGAGPITSVTRTTSAEPGQVPQGTITFGTPTIDGSSISQPFSYDLSDQTSFESRIDGGAEQGEISPVTVGSLGYEQSVLIEVRAVNATGPGQWFSVTRTTDAEPVVLPDGIGPGRDNVINPGSTFVITSTITSLAAGESLLAFITIAGTRHYLTVTDWNAGDITVTAPGNLPVSASPELTVQKISLIAA